MVAVVLLNDLAAVAACLYGAERKETAFVASVLSVVQETRADVDGALAATACSALRGYLLRNPDSISPLLGANGSGANSAAGLSPTAQQHPSSSLLQTDDLFHGLPAPAVTAAEREALIDFVRATLVDWNAWRFPARALGAVDVAGALFEANAVGVRWFVDLIFDAQTAIAGHRPGSIGSASSSNPSAAAETSRGFSPFQSCFAAFVAASLLVHLASELGIASLGSYARGALKANLTKGLVDLHAKRHFEDTGSINAAPLFEADGEVTEGCWFLRGHVQLADPNVVYPFDSPQQQTPVPMQSAQAVSRDTTALYLVRHRASIPRLVAEFGKRKSDEAIESMLRGMMPTDDADGDHHHDGPHSDGDEATATIGSPTADQFDNVDNDNAAVVALPSFVRSLATAATGAVAAPIAVVAGGPANSLLLDAGQASGPLQLTLNATRAPVDSPAGAGSPYPRHNLPPVWSPAAASDDEDSLASSSSSGTPIPRRKHVDPVGNNINSKQAAHLFDHHQQKTKVAGRGPHGTMLSAEQAAYQAWLAAAGPSGTPQRHMQPSSALNESLTAISSNADATQRPPYTVTLPANEFASSSLHTADGGFSESLVVPLHRSPQRMRGPREL
jgi:hypothetical protein